jgi:glycosyltransferase involved in cell wall biosynthesis
VAKSICIATIDFEPLVVVGGIGTCYNALAKLLSRNGWDVTVLFHSSADISRFAEEYQHTYGINFYNANALVEEAGRDLFEFTRDSHWAQGRSHIFHEALNLLTSNYKHHFNLVEFPEWGGAAFIPIQMKKNLGLLDARMIVRLQGPTEWVDEGLGKEYADYDDLKLNYLEKYSFENADIQVSPTRHLLQWCSEHGWTVRPEASLCATPCNVPSVSPQNEVFTKRHEIVFFGRFEERKGVIEFIEALRYIRTINPEFPAQYRITFLGKEGSLSQSYIAHKLHPFKWDYLTLERDHAISYLVKNARLVAIPSRLDNFPNTVLECMAARIPFVTSRSGGIPEILQVGSELYESVSTNATNPESLGELIRNYLRYDNERIQRLLNLASERCREVTDPQAILKWYEERVTNVWLEIPTYSPSIDHEAVTVIVPTRNVGKYLETALHSLLNQTFDKVKILIFDTSTDQRDLQLLDSIEQKGYGNVRVIRERDEGRYSASGVGRSMNQALTYVDTKYVMQCDGDNISKAKMVETFVKCIRNRKDVAALSSYHAAFWDEDEEKVLACLRNETKFEPRFYFKPIGPCLPALFFENTQGDANSIYLTEAIRAVGGWPEAGFHDWGLWLRLIRAGYAIDVIPTILYYFRDRRDSVTKLTKRFEVDEANIRIIQSMIESRPELVSRYYRSIHRLARFSSSLRNDVDRDLESKKSNLPALVEGATLDLWFKRGLVGISLKGLVYYYLYSRRWGHLAALRKMMRDGSFHLRRRQV